MSGLDVLPEHEARERALGSGRDADLRRLPDDPRVLLDNRAALDAKYEELTGFGYDSHCAPYDVTPELRFAMVDDPDGNTILLSASAS